MKAELTPAGVAAKLANVDWLTLSPGREYVYAASEIDTFNGKPTGEVASFRVVKGKLVPLSAQNSASVGTCHVALDRTGRVLISADYGGGSAASFLVTEGRLSPAVWTEHYTKRGPNKERQESAHAHFASYSPDNRFAYVNDLGGDLIHIYSVNTATAELKSAGAYEAKPGSGPRTLHFHTNGHTAYSVNELDSTVDVLEWNKKDGSLTRTSRINLLREGYTRSHHRLRHRDFEGWKVGLLLESLRRLYLYLQSRSEDRPIDPDRSLQLRRKDSPQLRARPHGTLDAGGQSGLERHQRVCPRSADRETGGAG